MANGQSVVTLVAHESKNIDTVCYRGSAQIRDLARISQPDIFDQELNADGLQRDLSPKHAHDAYEYVRREEDRQRPRAYPEVVLNVRDPRVLVKDIIWDGSASFPPANRAVREALEVDTPQLVLLKFHLDLMERDSAVYVSRVDGNHRLEFANGEGRRPALSAFIPFQIHIGLTRDQERSLFVDMNSNQKGLNTSHLSIMQSKLTPEQEEIRDFPWRWIAKRLAEHPESPWHGLVHLGGSKKGSRVQGLSRVVNFSSLESGVNRTLKKSQYIHDLTDSEAQYRIVRNYWVAVKRTYSHEWSAPKEHLVLKNLGVQSFSILGGTIIDRCMPRGKVQVEDFEIYLRQTQGLFDWRGDATGEGSLRGMTGNQAATIVAAEMAKQLSDETGLSLANLQAELLGK